MLIQRKVISRTVALWDISDDRVNCNFDLKKRDLTAMGQMTNRASLTFFCIASVIGHDIFTNQHLSVKMASNSGQENMKEGENAEYVCLIGVGGFGEVHKVTRIAFKSSFLVAKQRNFECKYGFLELHLTV